MQTKGFFRKGQRILLLFFCCLSLGLSVHPFYISVTEVEVLSKEKKVKLSCKLFLDDIQHELATLHKKEMRLTEITAANTGYLTQYIQSHLEIRMGKQILQFSPVGYEIEEEAVWVYLESAFQVPSTSFTIHNTLLCSALPAQTNIVHCIRDGSRQSCRLLCPETNWNFEF